MKKGLNLYKDIFWAVSLYVYALGLLGMICFYMQFGISIAPYFSLYDGLISMIYTIIVVGICLGVIEFITYMLYIFITERQDKKKPDDPYDEDWPKKYRSRTLVAHAVIIFIYSIATIWIKFEFRWEILSILILHIIIKVFVHLKKDEDKVLLRTIFYSGIVFLTLFVCGISCSEARKIIDGKTSIEFEITTIDTVYSSKITPYLFYIGESSSTVFLYDRKNNNTIYLNREYIRELRFIDYVFSTEQKEAIQNKYNTSKP